MSVFGFAGGGRKSIGRQILLLKELAKDPRGMGTMFPSSDALANEMASAVSSRATRRGILIEIGAGTGPVTAALLRRGVPARRMIVIEKSPTLAEYLSKRFPEVNVRCCGAEEMNACVAHDDCVSAIVSSLPFRSLPKEASMSIMSEVERTLVPGGVFIQFTYAVVGNMPFIPAGFRKVRSRFVPFNLPPAKVEVYLKPRTKIFRYGLETL
ncbi:MAG: methyltransferase domain-containing protein [Synergistaceae bacterium]|jgi:phospholipid N-methyltransferase|nr:methyltransferase domain-containing protein [Synergistaceae bacterium]